ncbi:MAG: MFS transporter [Planctomycetota bacterium]
MTVSGSNAGVASSAELAGPGWSRLAPILAVHFIGTLGFSIALPFLVFLVTDFGGAPWTYGIVGATYSASQLVGAPILGRWSDRVGRVRVLALSQAGTLTAWLVFLVALHLPLHELGSFAGATITVPLVLVFLARMLDGLTGGNISVASAYVADLTRGDEQSRQVAFGRMGMAASLGFTIGPAIAGGLGGIGDGYTASVAAAAIVSGLAMLLCLTLEEPRQRCPDGPPEQPAVSRVLGQQQRRCDRAPDSRERSSLRQPRVVGFLVATFVLFLAFNLFYAGFPIHATQTIGWSAGEMGAFFALLSGVMIFAQGPLLSRVSKRLPRSVVFASGVTLLLAAFVVFPTESSTPQYAGAVLFAAGNGIAWPTFQAAVASAASDEDQGAVQGAVASAGALASIAGLTAGGIAYPALGGSLFLVGAGLFAVVLLATPALFRSRR